MKQPNLTFSTTIIHFNLNVISDIEQYILYAYMNAHDCKYIIRAEEDNFNSHTGLEDVRINSLATQVYI